MRTFGLTESDVLYFETFGSKWVVLNSLKAAAELLEKRGSRYADRPRFVMFEECVSVTSPNAAAAAAAYQCYTRICC